MFHGVLQPLLLIYFHLSALINVTVILGLWNSEVPKLLFTHTCKNIYIYYLKGRVTEVEEHTHTHRKLFRLLAHSMGGHNSQGVILTLPVSGRGYSAKASLCCLRRCVSREPCGRQGRFPIWDPALQTDPLARSASLPVPRPPISLG